MDTLNDTLSRDSAGILHLQLAIGAMSGNAAEMCEISLQRVVYGDRSYASGFESVLFIGKLLSTARENTRLWLRLASSRVLVASDWWILTGCPTCDFWWLLIGATLFGKETSKESNSRFFILFQSISGAGARVCDFHHCSPSWRGRCPARPLEVYYDTACHRIETEGGSAFGVMWP